MENNGEEQGNTMYIDFIKVYAPVLLVLAERANPAGIIEKLNKVVAGNQTEEDVNAIQQWVESPEIENAMGELTTEEINNILSQRIAENQDPNVQLPDISLSGIQGFCALGQQRTNDCIIVNGRHYHPALFYKYYKGEKEASLDSKIVDPYREIIPSDVQTELDEYFAKLNEQQMTRKSQRKTPNGGKKSRKSKSKKSRKTLKKSRKSRRRRQ
jgi:hypothetical protein